MTEKTTATPMRLHTVPEVAEQWGICERTVRRCIADGRLQCVRIGRSVRVSDAQMEAFIAAQQA